MLPRSAATRWLALLLLLGASTARGAEPGQRAEPSARGTAPIVPRANAPSAIAWRGWERSAFDDARHGRKLVLLHIAASWSHSGHQMDAEAWTDSAVVRLVHDNFIPIRVDADRRPDIADRYLAGGWPTTAVLNADGQELLAQPVVEPRGLRQFLTHMLDLYRKSRSELELRSQESARRVAGTWKSEPAPPPEMSLDDWVDRNLAAVREAEDHDHGGLLGAPKNPPFEAARFLFAVTATHPDEPLRSLGLRLLDASFHLEDTEWGGFYRMASDADWKNPRTEKLLDVNARAIDALVAATEQGGGAPYREAARRTEAWAGKRLWTTRGGWYGSESADAIASDGSGRWIGGDVYYGLPDHFRRLQGAPAVDSSLYAEQNARMAAAVLRGAAAGLWKGAPVARAVKALDRLWSSQRAPDGSLYHEWRNGRRALPGRLMDQAEAGVAYLQAYAVTGEARHLARAESLAVWMRAHLEDKVAGGFRYAPRAPDAIGRLAAGEKPEQGNLDAGWLYWRLWQLKHRPEDRRSAQRALESLRSGDTVVLDPAEAELGLAMRAGPAASP